MKQALLNSFNSLPLRSAIFALALFGFAHTASADFFLNEIRIDDPGTDDNEYVEIYSDVANASLDGLTLIVLGDGSGGSGHIERAFAFDSTNVFDGSFFLMATPSFQFDVPVDYGIPVNAFENSDNLTFLLVTGFSGAEGDDIDIDDDGEPNETLPWTSVIDGVGVIEEGNPPTGTEYEYATVLGFPTVGPDGNFVPGHSYRETDGTGIWTIGVFSDDQNSPDLTDTPRGSNRPGDELTLTVVDDAILESAGAAATTITITGDLIVTEDTAITIRTNDGSELFVVSTATIPMGSNSVTINVDAVDDLWPDGEQTVTVQAGAPGYVSGSIDIVVEDDVDDMDTVVVNEVYAAVDTGGGDANQDGTSNASEDEFVEIVNASGADMDLSGWTIQEGASLSGFTSPQHVFPAGTILPNECAIVVFGGGDVATGINLAFGGANVQIKSSAGANGLDLTNGGDIVSLKNAAGIEVSGVNLPDTFGLGSWSRIPDITGEFSGNIFTPGYEVDGITEFCDVGDAVSLSISTGPFTEGGADATLTISVPANVNADTGVNLLSNDPTEATVVATATILSGTSSITTPVSFPDDSDEDGSQSVLITAMATDFITGQLTITVEDDGNDGGVFVLGSLVINEVLFDPNGADGILDANGDGDGSSTADEFVELVNTSGGVLDISGWTLSDAAALRITFPDGTTVAAGCAVVVFGGGTPTGTFGGSQVFVASLGLSNGGDTVTLRDASDALVSEVFWSSGGIGDGFSANLNPDLTGTAFIEHTNLAGSVGLASPGTFGGGGVFCDPGTGGGYAAWATANGVVEAPDGDDDNDGKSNLIEYAAGCDPKVPDALNILSSTNPLQISVPKGTEASAAGDLTYAVEVSSDLVNWSTTDISITTNNSVTFVAEYQGSGTEVFMRLVVTLTQ